MANGETEIATGKERNTITTNSSTRENGKAGNTMVKETITAKENIIETVSSYKKDCGTKKKRRDF